MKQIYAEVFGRLLAGATERETLEALAKDDRFSVMVAAVVQERTSKKDFDSEAKSAVFLKAALASPLRCGICGGLIHYSSITMDHIERREDGGLGVVDNGQLAHPYCNTTYKN